MSEPGIIEVKQKPDVAIIGYLEELLARAKAGDVQQIAVVTHGPVGGWCTHYVGHVDILLGGLERIRFYILKRAVGL